MSPRCSTPGDEQSQADVDPHARNGSRPCCGGCSTRPSSCPTTAFAPCRATTSIIRTSSSSTGTTTSVKYLPAESDSRLFGGNSNWRGPIWFPVNYMIVRSLHEFSLLLRRRLQGRVPDRLRPDAEPRRGRPRDCRTGSARIFLARSQPRRPPRRVGRQRVLPDRSRTGATASRSTNTSTATPARASARAIKPAGPRSSSRCCTNTGSGMAAINDDRRADRIRSAPRVDAGGRELLPLLEARHRRRAAAVRPRRRCAARASVRARSRRRTAPTTIGTCTCAGMRAGQLYGYRVAGPNDPAAGLRFDPREAARRSVRAAPSPTPRTISRAQAAAPGDNAAVALKSVVVDPPHYDWEGDTPLERPFVDSVIYEMHVAGFTRNPNSGVAADEARHLRRPDREDSVPASTSASRPSN